MYYVCMYVCMQAKLQASKWVVLFTFRKIKHKKLPTVCKPNTQGRETFDIPEHTVKQFCSGRITDIILMQEIILIIVLIQDSTMLK